MRKKYWEIGCEISVEVKEALRGQAKQMVADFQAHRCAEFCVASPFGGELSHTFFAAVQCLS